MLKPEHAGAGFFLEFRSGANHPERRDSNIGAFVAPHPLPSFLSVRHFCWGC